MFESVNTTCTVQVVPFKSPLSDYLVQNVDLNTAKNGTYFDSPLVLHFDSPGEDVEIFTRNDRLIQRMNNSFEWTLGSFDRMEDNVLHYVDGQTCNADNIKARIAKITIYCGEKTSLVSFAEVEMCVYELEATICFTECSKFC